MARARLVALPARCELATMDATPPPPAIMMQLLLGRWVSQAIGAATKLGLADHLADGPRSAAELAELAKAHAPSVHRLLRALAGFGVFRETEPGQFSNTPLSETLRDVPGSVRPLSLFVNHDAHLRAWGAIEHSVRTGKSGFMHAHGALPWDYIAQHPDVGEVFNGAMTALSAQSAPAVAMAYDFSGSTTLADIGGGHGFLLGTILAKHPQLRGVLFDMPQVVAGAPAVLAAAGVADRCTVVGGDFFAEVPAADTYVMKHIIHDWDDDASVRIFKAIHRAAAPGAKLLLAEGVIRPGNEPDLGKLIDIEMLVVTDGGRERTEDEYRTILAAGGWALQRVIPTMSPLSLLEAVRV
jgi:hypothetical protein